MYSHQSLAEGHFVNQHLTSRQTSHIPHPTSRTSHTSTITHPKHHTSRTSHILNIPHPENPTSQTHHIPNIPHLEHPHISNTYMLNMSLPGHTTFRTSQILSGKSYSIYNLEQDTVFKLVFVSLKSHTNKEVSNEKKHLIKRFFLNKTFFSNEK